ncbi:uncharacterized protein TEOVI_000011900 [Trypanosoma equiperdum]|uniref:Uncharacterized protein n=4 Tax=Trypanozoon TaxID=39700 RepID=Q57ZU3_TRYB2|nr:hypothetical protein, conserved [Trypanosoma brucei gambiense DAL972]XP_844939.1 hypothetical protein, conserved [Trypanosoma brucei brucei TREU927]AAX79381.1 hypothetical protein, conserved [Trypanosoma brucei]RHW72573.1 hypothetical protein DPX39_050033100 [Trypanosoma brucei equiperdum]SCU64726.1 hypothetical protein, conserved [Trypanosoma equiperdum]AAZ11380.1 hypothetical protein, conserved [Trypanosoma brucei brucei TREU927]CBH11237.1 hypothetical protein, conserved [Trypanosoma bru|eukprot:XP_011773524.1 hypothetical protein, conserved [Trypanosoma brucei gambiense DAL972]
MPLWSFVELSSSFLSPVTVGVSPFFRPLEERLNTEPPAVREVVWEYMHCTKRAINTRIIGFCEPTLNKCVDDLRLYLKASAAGGSDEASLAEVLRRRRGEVDADSLPWESRAEYKEWLRTQGRLKCG